MKKHILAFRLGYILGRLPVLSVAVLGRVGRALRLFFDGLFVVLAFVCLVAFGALCLVGSAIYGGWSLTRR